MITLGNAPIQAVPSFSAKQKGMSRTPRFGIAMHRSEAVDFRGLKERLAAIDSMRRYKGIPFDGAAFLDKLTRNELETGEPKLNLREKTLLHTAFKTDFDDLTFCSWLIARAIEKLKESNLDAYNELSQVVSRGQDLSVHELDWRSLYAGAPWEVSTSTTEALKEVGLMNNEGEFTPYTFDILRCFRLQATNAIQIA